MPVQTRSQSALSRSVSVKSVNTPLQRANRYNFRASTINKSKVNNYFYESEDSDYEEQDDMKDRDYEPEPDSDYEEDEGSIYEPDTDSDYEEDEDEGSVYDPEEDILSTINMYTINKYDKHGLTPLMRAVLRRDLALVKIIISVPGVDINKFSSIEHCFSPLCKYGLQSMFEYTALGFALYTRCDDIANQLLATPGINHNKVIISAGNKYK